jgi:hypothetical protein
MHTDVTGGKPTAALSLSISCVNAINPLVAFYDIHGSKREVLFFCFVPNNTRDRHINHTNRQNVRQCIISEIEQCPPNS